MDAQNDVALDRRVFLEVASSILAGRTGRASSALPPPGDREQAPSLPSPPEQEGGGTGPVSPDTQRS